MKNCPYCGTQEISILRFFKKPNKYSQKAVDRAVGDKEGPLVELYHHIVNPLEDIK